MSLGKADVEKIAHLARLAVGEDEISEYANQLSKILDLVDRMNAVDTTDVTPMAHPLDTTQRLRRDVVTERDERENFQSIAPLVQAGLYLVPKVID